MKLEWTTHLTDVHPDLIRLLTGEEPAPKQERALLFRYDKPIPCAPVSADRDRRPSTHAW